MSGVKQKLLAISRRDFLLGASQVAISLPFLEYMLEEKAYAAGIPKRMIVFFNGVALGNIGGSYYTPSGTGLNWTPNIAHQSISNYPLLKPYITIITNLAINQVGKIVNDGPGADQDFGHHEFGWKIQLTGNGSYNPNDENDWRRIAGTTWDRYLKNNLNLSSGFEHINYMVQPRYGASVAMQADNGVSFNAVSDPFIAFNAMTSLATPTTTSVNTQRIFQLTQQKSILDLLETNRVGYLNKLLGAADKQKLSNHFDMIREIEKKVAADLVTAQTTTGAPMPLATCRSAAAPSGDFTIHDNGVYSFQPTNLNDNWSNEPLRSQIFRDIATMGLSCDKARIGTIMLTQAHSWINGYGLTGGQYQSDYHELSHGAIGYTSDQRLRGLSTCTGWHVNEIFKFAEGLRSIPEGTGNMLDNTLLLMVNEGGFDSTIGSHTQLNSSIMIIGKGGLTPKGVVNAGQAHNSRAILTAMNAVGYTGGSLGGVSTELSVLK